MALFKKKDQLPKNENSRKYKRMMAERIDGKHIKCCSEKTGNDETILGKEGGINLRGDEITVLASGKVVFRADIYDLRISEFLSLEGAFLRGHDLEHGGEEKTVIVYYTYYI